jgi:hypothetical protein
MWEKFSIISSLCHMRDGSRNRLIESSASSFFFSYSMEVFLGALEIFSSRETILRPKFIYSDLVKDMH